MELELKHIVGYLPYGLKIKTNNLVREMVCERIIYDDDEYKLKVPILNVITGIGHKPIIRQLSDLTKEIEVNGEKFVPIDFLEGMFGDCSKLTDTMLVNSFVPYGIVRKLYEWHFDIHGLIEKGLAIDINTLGNGIL